MKRINDYRCTSCGKVEERYWDVDAANPLCTECNSETERMLAAPAISYTGDKTFRQRVPNGFKDVLKNISNNTPDTHKGARFSGL